MKKIILTLTFLCAFTFVNAQQTVSYYNAKHVLVTRLANEMVPILDGAGNPTGQYKSAQEIANTWNTYWANQSQSATVTQQLVVEQPEDAESKAIRLEREKLINKSIQADIDSKNANTIYNGVATVTNTITAAVTSNNNTKLVNAYLFGNGRGVVNPNWNNPQYPATYPDVHMGTGGNVIVHQYNTSNPAWSGNCGYQPVMPQTYGNCRM